MNPLFIRVVEYLLWFRVARSYLRRVFLRFFIREYSVYSMCLSVKDEFYTVFGVVAIKLEVLLGVCGVCDDLAIYVFYQSQIFYYKN